MILWPQKIHCFGFLTENILVIILSGRQCSLKSNLICKSLTCSLLELNFQDYIFFIPLPDDKILDSSKLKEFADDDFKFDENGRKLSKWVENTGKRRNCSLQAISPSPTVFSEGLFPRGVKRCHCLGIG